MPNAIPGICGPFYDGCHLSWASTEPVNVGSYPSEWLPSNFTVWHGLFTARFPPAAPLLPPGSFGPIGGGLIDAYIPTIPSPISFQSHMVVSFCQTTYTLNRTYTLTDLDIKKAFSNVELGNDGKPLLVNGKNISKQVGYFKIKLNSYVFDAVSITDVPFSFSQELTPEEKLSLISNQEFEADRIFRKIFDEVPPESNRLVGVDPNTEGIAYRLDNGTSESNEMLDGPGLGDLSSVAYRDGTSDTVIVDLSKYIKTTISKDGQPDTFLERGNQTGSTLGNWKQGDSIYVSFVEVKKHYMRQYINITWTLFDGGTAFTGAYAIPQSIRGANYKFFEWNAPDGKDSKGNQLTKQLHGWRAVESFGIKSNAMIIFGSPSPLVDFPESVNLTSFVQDQGTTWTRTQYKESDWYKRRQYNSYDQSGDKYEHIFYNIHPKSLAIKDTNKFGIERFLAQELQTDIQNGRNTLFPFLSLDDSRSLVYTEELINSSNTKFDPIQPVTQLNIANCYSTTAVRGSFNIFGVPYGWNNGTGDLITYHSYDSPIIREKFDKNTRILVERFFAYGASQDIGAVSIKALPKSSGHAVSCVSDPSGIFSTVTHYDQDQNIVFNSFKNKVITSDYSYQSYRPDKTIDLSKITSITSSIFPRHLGYNGLLGDAPGYFPGKRISLSKQTAQSSFTYTTTDKTKVPSRFFQDSTQVKNFGSPPYIIDTNRLILPLDPGFYGTTRIDYSTHSTGQFVNVILRSGGPNGTIVAVIENIYLSGSGDSSTSEEVLHEWFLIDTVEFVGDIISSLKIISATVVGIDINQAVDFLTDKKSDTTNSGNITQKKVTQGVFVQNPVSTISEDIRSNLYVFFEDLDHNVSCMYSNDFGYNWLYYYGIIEKMNQYELSNPFSVSDFLNNKCYIFYQTNNKIAVKCINFNHFNTYDAMVVERTIPDVLEPANRQKTLNNVVYDVYNKKRESLYSVNGLSSIRNSPSFFAAGNLNDLDFVNNAIYKKIVIENEKDTIYKLFPLEISSSTALPRTDVTNIFFSAYLNKSSGKGSGRDGFLKLFFINTVVDEVDKITGQGGGGQQLQCYFSSDEGQTWFDLWEYLNYGRNRQRLTYFSDNDASNIDGRLFIDRSFNGIGIATTNESETIVTDEKNQFGINIHWSRMKKHKIQEGNEPVTSESESEVLLVTSPYLFYQESFQRVFLFYIYENVLLCKVFSDDIFYPKTSDNQYYFKHVKNLIEKNTKSWFIDGDLSGSSIREEIHGYINPSTNEQMNDGNILFPFVYAIDSFDSDRFVLPQRVCAYELPNGYVRIMYKIGNNNKLTSALWFDDSFGWRIEEKLVSIEDKDYSTINGILEVYKNTNPSLVCGGFGENSFNCSGVS